jgi:predicted regulator of Ras-like GTPase activity (Roadblock/LC7/MglB family)
VTAAFGSLGKGHHKRKLERELAREPTPEKAAELIREHVRTGETERALEIARKATIEFPESQEISHLFSQAERLQRREGIAHLRSAIEGKSPKPGDYAELARLVEEAGDANAALEICMDGLAAFPASAELYMRLGSMRMGRFHCSMLAKDGIAAVQALEKAIEIQPSTSTASILLAQLYLEIGFTRKARELVDTVSRLYLNDEQVLRLQEALKQAPPQEADDPQSACKRVERDQRLVMDLTEEEAREGLAPLLTPRAIANRLARVPTFVGFRGAVLLGEGGTAEASKVEKGTDAEKLARTTSAVMNAVQSGSLRMDTGPFNEGIIKTSEGRIYLRILGDRRFALVCGADARSDEALDYISAVTSPGNQ